MRTSVFVFVAVFGLAGVVHAENVAWQVDPAHTTVGFVVRHMAISNVRGTLSDFSGVVQADKETGKPSSIEGTVQIKSIDTGIAKRDEHLRAPDFFDAAKFPVMTLKTKSIVWTGNEFTAPSILTIKGISKEVVLKGEYLGVRKANFGQGDTVRAGITASMKINRQEFGLTWNMVVEGTGIVADEVKIELDSEIFRNVK